MTAFFSRPDLVHPNNYTNYPSTFQVNVAAVDLLVTAERQRSTLAAEIENVQP